MLAKSKVPFGPVLLTVIFAASTMIVYQGVQYLVASRRHEVERAEVHTRNLAQAIDQNIKTDFERIDHAVRAVVHEIERKLASGKFDLSDLARFIAFEQQFVPGAVAIRVTDADGTVIINNPSNDASAHFRDRPFWSHLRDHPEAGVFITKPILGTFTKRWVITSARRYNLPNGRFGGVVVLPVFIEHFQESLSGFEVGVGGMLTLRDAEGGFVARHPILVKGKVLAVGDKTSSPELQKILASGAQQQTYLTRTPFDQTWRTLTFRRVENSPYFIVASLAEEEYLASWRQTRTVTLALIAASLVGSWLLFWLLWQSWKERERSTAALQASEAQFRAYIERSIDVIFTLDPQGTLTFLSPAWDRHFGYPGSEVLGKSFVPVVHPEDVQPCMDHFTQVLSTGQSLTSPPFRVRHADGSWRWFRANGTILPSPGGEPRYMGVAHDITELQRMEEEKAELEAQNRQLQKAESLGLMAGSIAHLFNNKLQTVMASLELLGDFPEGADRSPFLATARHATAQAAEVSKSMLVYLGQSTGPRELLFLSQLTLEILAPLKDNLPASVAMDIQLPAPGPAIHADPDQIRMLLSSLVANAREAMGEAGGQLRVRLRTCAGVEIPNAHRFPIGWRPLPQDYVCLEVADTGCGIPAPDIERLFDPFFSTKFIGRGLGLAVVLGIVQAHDAAVRVESRPGDGSVFQVFFPVSETVEPAPKDHGLPDSRPVYGGTVLLVDDDEMLRGSTGALLEGMGFTLLTAKDGFEAVEVLRRHRDAIRCVITDLTMPGMDGWATLTALRQIEPSLPVVLASGYDKAQVMASPHPDLPQAFLMKPYDLQQLREALDQALAGR